MNNLGTIELNTKRLTLKRFDVSFAKDMFNNWASSNNVTKFLTWHAHKSVQETKGVISSWVDKYKYNDFYQWAIVINETQDVIGSIGVVKLDKDNETAICGYCIGEKWWGKGITAEAYKKVIEFLFNEVKIKKIIGRHDVDNPNSGKVMIKCGLKYVKTIKNAGTNVTNNSCDLAIYEIINDKE